MLEVNGANGSVHGAQEEEQIRTAASTWQETQTGVLPVMHQPGENSCGDSESSNSWLSQK